MLNRWNENIPSPIWCRHPYPHTSQFGLWIPCCEIDSIATLQQFQGFSDHDFQVGAIHPIKANKFWGCPICRRIYLPVIVSLLLWCSLGSEPAEMDDGKWPVDCHCPDRLSKFANNNPHLAVYTYVYIYIYTYIHGYIIFHSLRMMSRWDDQIGNCSRGNFLFESQ
jgi:hypothetical protein